MKQRLRVALSQKVPNLPTGYSVVDFKSFFPIIEAAFDDNRKWLEDFKNDRIIVPDDLSDVVLAYQQFCTETGPV